MSYEQKIRDAFNRFNGKNLEVLDLFYSQNVTFQDPVTVVKGLPALKKYYQHAYSKVISIRFNFTHFYQQADTVCASWVMTLAVQGLNGGKPYDVEGLSVMTFDQDQKVIQHRDYVDLGAMVYEQIPVQGKIIKTIKGFLKP